MTARRFAPAEWLERLPAPDGARSVLVEERGTLTLKLYAPRGIDPQQPHVRDEVYVVISGRGLFAHGEHRDPFGPGDFLFAAAGLPHRFEEFTDDLAVWVIFYGPDGGEQPAMTAARIERGAAFEHGSLRVGSGGAGTRLSVTGSGELVVGDEIPDDAVWVMSFA